MMYAVKQVVLKGKLISTKLKKENKLVDTMNSMAKDGWKVSSVTQVNSTRWFHLKRRSPYKSFLKKINN